MSDESKERRKTTEDPFLNYICTQLENLNVNVVALRADLTAQKVESHETAAAVARIEAAFPQTDTGERDFSGHHYDHRTRMEAAKSWKEIWQDTKKKLFGGAAWAIVVLIVYALWESLKQEVKK